jgi:tRNA (guanine-N7-)-methyltransferase
MPALLQSKHRGYSQPRPIRSFVRREGRMTHAQRSALEQLWPSYGVDLEAGKLNLEALFNREAPRILELGFGNGESLIQQAQVTPGTDFLGVEVYRPGIGHLLLGLEAERLTNVRLICEDAQIVLHHLPDQGVDGVQIFFPDPWPKKRHHKRRLIQLPFVAQLEGKIKPGGWLHLATDCQDYAQHMLAVLSACPRFRYQSAETRGRRPRTKFERRGERLGHSAWDLRYQRLE